jgi:hypothetical protein
VSNQEENQVVVLFAINFFGVTTPKSVVRLSAISLCEAVLTYFEILGTNTLFVHKQCI